MVKRSLDIEHFLMNLIETVGFWTSVNHKRLNFRRKLKYFAMNAQDMGNVGNGSIPGFGLQQAPTNSVEEMLMRQRLGQEIPHFSNGPKRTESLYISPARKKEKVNIHYARLSVGLTQFYGDERGS